MGKGIPWQDGEQLALNNSTSTSLIVSLLVRYSELASVTFDPECKELQLVFVLSEPLEQETFDAFQRKTNLSLEIYLELSGREQGKIDISYLNHENHAFIEIRRDVQTLSQGEIALLHDLVMTHFGARLISEQEDNLGEEELEVHEAIIENMLEDLKESSRADKTLIGFREEGRVLVFNSNPWHNKN
ncbi:MAG TPA: hypothetical protein DF292_09950 [Firmicutes bacterium]|jgi:hypothetical protein|nr:hypothetical protein [Bacillota bacterium]HBG42960.1 hypothetical protein [Bacillota bacterium]HBL50511.1 hypothetical protein [Bacillota bacterium]HBL67699.1 hypothetical protein [Bacillota bacterium]HBR24799.1 hypothetical protein [Bacillota bacterium]